MDRQIAPLITAFGLGAVAAAAVSQWLCRGSRSRSLARFLQPPHPTWKPGEKQQPPFDKWDFVTIDPAKTEKASLYTFCISAVVPRPVAFISSLGPDGSQNLSPFSYFNIMNHYPPIVTIGMSRAAHREDGKKDSLYNIESTK
jgi:hypothetical protein